MRYDVTNHGVQLCFIEQTSTRILLHSVKRSSLQEQMPIHHHLPVLIQQKHSNSQPYRRQVQIAIMNSTSLWLSLQRPLLRHSVKAHLVSVLSDSRIWQIDDLILLTATQSFFDINLFPDDLHQHSIQRHDLAYVVLPASPQIT